MTKLPSRRLLLTLGILSAMGITGCDMEDSGKQPGSALSYDNNDPTCAIRDVVTGECLVIDETPDGDFFIPGTHPRFSPAESDLPLNTDILFSGTTDGTAFVEPEDPANPNPVEKAINAIDGWSVSAAFDIAFSAAIDPASVSIGGATPGDKRRQNVFVVPLNSDGDALDPSAIDADNPVDSTYTPDLIAQVLSLDGGTDNVLRLAPATPLKGPRKYLVIVTDGVRDAAGDRITRSAPFEVLSSGDAEACAAQGVVEQLQPLCDAIGGWHAIAANYLSQRNKQLNKALFADNPLPTGVAQLEDSVALTYTFTTTDPLTPLLAMGAPRAALVKAQVDAGLDKADAVQNVKDLLTAGVALSSPQPRPVNVNAATATPLAAFSASLTSGARLYTGTIKLPYYQHAPADENDIAYFGQSWEADEALGAAAGPILGTTLPPEDVDGSRNVTYRYPFAQKTSQVTVPLQVTLPSATFTPTGAPANCGTLYNGILGTGYPVVIYVHGITANRTSVIALADSLAKACVATVAIDLPMHGVPANAGALLALNIEQSPGLSALYPSARERHFNQRLDGSTGLPVPMDFAAPGDDDGSGTLFINLLNFANTRDNVKQAVMDLLNLNASLGTISALNLDAAGSANDFDLAKVYVVGVSLGGIIGTTFTAVNQLAYASDGAIASELATGGDLAGAAAFSPRVNAIKGLATSAPGGQLTKLLENSQAFAPTILGGLEGAGVPQGTADFEKFLYVFQGVVDSADPVNMAAILNNGTVGILDIDGDGVANDILTENGLDVKLLMQEVVGLPFDDATELASDEGVLGLIGDTKDPAKYVADKVVPNNAFPLSLGNAVPAPLAGTDPLARLLGLTQATSTGASQAIGNGILAKLQVGHHASVLRPNENGAKAPTNGELLATVELQTQVVRFVANGGAATDVGTAGAALGMPANTAANFIKTN